MRLHLITVDVRTLPDGRQFVLKGSEIYSVSEKTYHSYFNYNFVDPKPNLIIFGSYTIIKLQQNVFITSHICFYIRLRYLERQAAEFD